MDEERENVLFTSWNPWESATFLVSRQGSFIFGGEATIFLYPR